jgi:hypothetical protein
VNSRPKFRKELAKVLDVWGNPTITVKARDLRDALGYMLISSRYITGTLDQIIDKSVRQFIEVDEQEEEE